ncbi:MAG: hypothetical protein M3Z00_03025 [Actinomycetota bacterium]|nr:hypothetical protein [Actinomycetota bacterium]
MRLLRGTVRLTDTLRRSLDTDEMVLAQAIALDGTELAATRKRLIVVPPEAAADSLGWHQIAKARLDAGTLTVIPMEKVAELPTGDPVLRDASPMSFSFDGKAKLTDQVHSRVRRSVAGSRRLPWPGAGGWVTIRRVAGRDGLILQLRLDHGADLSAPGFVDAVLRVGAELLGAASPGVTGVDE